jgi:hypothetical protein
MGNELQDRRVSVETALRLLNDVKSDKVEDRVAAKIAIEEAGENLIWPLAQIWRDGQVTASDFRIDQIGLLFASLGGVALVPLFFMASYLFTGGWRQSSEPIGWTIAVILALVALVVSIFFSKQACRQAEEAQSLAGNAGQLLSTFSQPHHAVRLLKCLYGQKGGRGKGEIIVVPIADALEVALKTVHNELVGPSGVPQAANVEKLFLDQEARLRFGVLTVQLLGIAERAGDITLLKPIERIARIEPHGPLQLAAHKCFVTLSALNEQTRQTNKLLRPTDKPEDEPGTLLRPAQTGAETAPELLLRPAQTNE